MEGGGEMRREDGERRNGQKEVERLVGRGQDERKNEGRRREWREFKNKERRRR